VEVYIATIHKAYGDSFPLSEPCKSFDSVKKLVEDRIIHLRITESSKTYTESCVPSVWRPRKDTDPEGVIVAKWERRDPGGRLVETVTITRHIVQETVKW
jgi:hypothetical protein